ncbi:O-acetylhomoserine aminocarboxypropyltransferase/cysteine synthase family protein [Thalassobaculum sp.]|uniref:O-acetylhomoserine aminocarboxypropyltransferase/cysteine synthase family protein n=1 Tax=Thalassobaculum sp. TaxID=2022740 RepID=UPI003B596503
MQTYTKPQTIALHTGHRADPGAGSIAVPIHMTTSYDLGDSENGRQLFALEKIGHLYTRVSNPTTDVLEQRIAALEGGVAALATASGQAAIVLAIQNITHAGDNIVVSSELYGGSVNLFANTLPTMGIEVRFVDPRDPEAFRTAADDRTRAFYGESLPNPSLVPFPVQEVALIGAELGIPLIIDNTCAPVICRPIDHGAHIVVHSSTKYIGGHGTAIGGLIVDAGRFDWAAHAERFPMLNRPDPSYHGAVWVEAAGPLGPVAYLLKARATLLRDTGAAMSPFNAFLFLQGLETLALRMREHCRNADTVALFLADHPAVARVIHPGHFTGWQKERVDTYLGGRHGGLVGFEAIGGVDAGRRFIDALRMILHVANIGDARTLALQPAVSTHQQLSETRQRAAGVTPGFVRLSVGIEDIDDILADLSQALQAAASLQAA